MKTEKKTVVTLDSSEVETLIRDWAATLGYGKDVILDWGDYYANDVTITIKE